MSDNILNDLFDIKEEKTIEFKELYGFTFVFMTSISSINEKISSAEIKPVGIIYTENEEYYFAPLDKVENTSEIIEEYVKIIEEVECPHFPQ
jgi:hypothetical protein